jgi:two-component system cell cycle sensor histidine kinase/response regulator CckA
MGSDVSSSETAKTILVVEDADAIRKMVCAMLTQNGYRCLEAVDGADALGLLDGHDIHLVLTDVVMPNMGGAELARHIVRAWPDMRIIFMSGYTEDPLVSAIRGARSIFLPKPFTAADLLNKVKDVFNQPWQGFVDDSRPWAGAP